LVVLVKKVKIKFAGIDISAGEYIDADENDYFLNKQMVI